MLIVIHHKMSDAGKFWGRAQENMPTCPKDLKLVGSFPGTDGVNAVCLWDAPTLATIRDYLEPIVGDVSKNEYFEMDASKAMGLAK